MRQVKKVLAAALLVVMWSTSAQAALGWFTAEIIAAGPADNGGMYMKLNDVAAVPAFNNKWFVASDSVKKEMLATVLTAITAGKRIVIKADPDAILPVVTRVFIVD